MDKHLLARASRVFNAGCDLRDEGDRTINEWFKQKLAEASQVAGCPEHTPAYVGCPDCVDTIAEQQKPKP